MVICIQTITASHFAHPMEISRDYYNDRCTFRSSDEEIGNEDSNIDVSEVVDESNENDESGSDRKGKGDDPLEWTDRLRNILVYHFTLPELDVFKMFF